VSYTISKDFGFSAGHALAGLPAGHPCARPHGHNYLARVELTAEDVDATGFVLDYGDLAPFADYLDLTMDHRWLGSGPCTVLGNTWLPVVPFNPTAELLAAHLGNWLVTASSMAAALERIVVRVGVSETGKTWAWTP